MGVRGKYPKPDTILIDLGFEIKCTISYVVTIAVLWTKAAPTLFTQVRPIDKGFIIRIAV